MKVYKLYLFLSIFCAITTLSLPIFAQNEKSESEFYISPYSVNFTFTKEELIEDFLNGDRGEIKMESKYPYDEWNSKEVLKIYGAWGPPPRHYLPLENFSKKSIEWKRERLIAVAMRYIGYQYQHHHIPDWHPPKDWPWLKAPCGYNSKGIDCSDFTSFAYNQAFGIIISSDIKIQSEIKEINFPNKDKKIIAKIIEKPETYEELIKELKTGDLLFIKASKDEHVSHVIIWIGDLGQAEENMCLILDSTGDGHKDSNGKPIPSGVHLRPFSPKSWYYNCFSHALRLLHEETKE